MFKIHDTLNGKNLDEVFHYNLTSEDVEKYKSSKIVI